MNIYIKLGGKFIEFMSMSGKTLISILAVWGITLVSRCTYNNPRLIWWYDKFDFMRVVGKGNVYKTMTIPTKHFNQMTINV